MHGRNVRKSNIKKKRKSGFLARMRSRFGRKVINKRRSIGRKLLPDF